jgi:DNA polymerase III alpha subunit (gram-positive type)
MTGVNDVSQAQMVDQISSEIMSGGIETVMMTVLTNRTNTLNEVVAGQVADMQQRNKDIAAKQNTLMDKRKELAKLDPDDDKKEYNEKQTEIENIKTEIDQMSSSSQLDMIKLQGLINKTNQSTEMMTNLLQKFSGVLDKIIGNMR